MKAPSLALAAVALALPASLYAAPLPPGQWQRLFARDVERTLGRAVLVDTASIRIAGNTRTYIEANVLQSRRGAYPKGTTLYYRRAVNCAGGRHRIVSWSIVAPDGRTIGSGTNSSPQSGALQWDTAQGKVLGYVCRGILPR